MNRRNGFSLVELMVIVAIIAFFLALTVPRFLRERNPPLPSESPKVSNP
ncbi:MAG: type II secretion system protein [Deltaproteobacteria bacterium]|nr:type II secretion system protein [Deltaproteobacteria bacterium]